MDRRGFTLLEMLFASGLFVLIVGGVLSAFVGVRKLSCTAFAEAELSVRMRELREKLLFHAAAPGDGKFWSGVLSGACDEDRSVIENGRIRMDSAWGYDRISEKPVGQLIEIERMQMSSSDGESVSCLVNNGDRFNGQNDKWLVPGGISCLPDEDLLDASRLNGKNDVFYVNLKASANGHLRRERIVVPVFGKVQRTMTALKVFDD